MRKKGKRDAKSQSLVKKIGPQLQRFEKVFQKMGSQMSKGILVLLPFQNTIMAFRLDKLAQAALAAKSQGRILSLEEEKLPYQWKIPLKGNVNKPLVQGKGKYSHLLFVTTDKGYIYCLDLSRDASNILRWQYFSPTLTSKVYLKNNLLFFADKIHLKKKGQGAWEYRVNCLLIRR